MDPHEDAHRGRQPAPQEPGGEVGTPPPAEPRTHEAAADARTARALRLPVAVWLGILAAIGVVQIVRAQWFDVAVYAVAVAVLTADALGLLPAVPLRRRVPLPWLLGGTAAIGAVMCFLPRHGLWMGVAVIAVGAVAAIVAWPQGTSASPPWTRGLRRLAIAWSAILVAGCLWELFQFVLGRIAPDLHWFALSDLLDPLVSTVPGRILFLAAWLGGGLFLVRRGRA